MIRAHTKSMLIFALAWLKLPAGLSMNSARHSRGAVPRRWIIPVILALGLTALASVGLNNWTVRAATDRFVAVGGSDTSNDCSNAGTPCATIQNAISQSGSGDQIKLGPGTYFENVILSQSVTILGDPTLNSTVDGTNTAAVFTINSGVTATLSGLTIINGNGNSGFDVGGGVSNNGTVTVTNCTITNNQAINGAGIFNRGFFGQVTLTVVDTIISSNLGGIGGGIYNNTGMATVMNTTISGNWASISGGIHNSQFAGLTVTGTTISGNSVVNNGAIGNDGTLTLTNSTINGNFAATAVGGIINLGTATLVNTTVYDNQTGSIGGPKGIDNRTTLNMINTIIGGSKNGVDCASAGTIATNSHNLIQDGSCSPAVSGDPKLGPLQNNGGRAFTMALLPGSPAIDAGDDSVLDSPLFLTTDQRGAGFPRKSGLHVDIGAFEVQPCTHDTQPPTITCPAHITAKAPAGSNCTIVNYTTPTSTDNCPLPPNPVVCSPPSGSCFARGTTTVTCTATDASDNTASCSFSVTVFDLCLQDDSNPATVLFVNSLTGEYRFCCGGTTFTGRGQITVRGSTYALQHYANDRRLAMTDDESAHRGTASLQLPPGTLRCTIIDRDTRNNSCLCQ